MGLLADRSVVVTGAAGGMGLVIARACLDEGARVIVTDLGEDQVSRALESLGSDAASGHVLDVTSERGWRTLGEELATSVGRPDALVNNAGFLTSRTLESTSLDDLRRTMTVNMEGPMLGIQEFVRLHRTTECTRPGSVVNMSSIRGLLTGARFAAYSASKFAVRGLTKSAAVELGQLGIRVNSICPGPIQTPMSQTNPDFEEFDWAAYISHVPLKRFGEAQDVANAVVWLVSSKSDFVTGIDLPVDGGLSATTYSITEEPTRDT